MKTLFPTNFPATTIICFSALIFCTRGTVSADIVSFSFDTPGNTEGWLLQASNGGVSVTQTNIDGEGYLRIENSGGFAQTGQLEFSQAPDPNALNAVVDSALANTGTLSFDVLIRADDLAPNFDFSFFELLVITQDQGIGFGQEVVNIGLPTLAAGETFTTTVTLDIALGPSSSQDDGVINYSSLSTDPSFLFRNLLIGTNSPGGQSTVINIDNVRFVAVPEPRHSVRWPKGSI